MSIEVGESAFRSAVSSPGAQGENHLGVRFLPPRSAVSPTSAGGFSHLGGQAVRVRSYDIGSGLIFELVGFALLVAALLLVLAGWTATVTDDDGATGTTSQSVTVP